MNIEILDSLKTVADTAKTVVDSTLVNVAPIVEKTIWQDKSLLTVVGFLGGIILIGTIFIVLDILSERKEKKEREQSKK